MAFRQVFLKKIKSINEERCQERYRRKKKRKSPKNGRETAIEKGKDPMVTGGHAPMVAGDPGNPGRRISAERAFFGRISSCLALVIFPESDF